MSFGIASKRTDWMQARSNVAGTFTQGPALHEVIGNLSGYEGDLTAHGDFCNRFTWASPTDPTILRYLHVDQRDDDTKACMVQAAMINEGVASQSYCGIVVKAQSGCSLYDITCVAKANIVDGELVTLYQTVAPTKTTNFIFDKGGSGPFDADNIQVDISATEVVTAEDVAEVLRTAINANSLPLRMAAERPAAASAIVRVMRTDDGSTSGDTPTTDVADPGFAVAKTANGSAGTTISNTVGGYVFTFSPSNNRYYLSRAKNYFDNTPAVYADVAAAPTAAKRWMGLKLVAMRVGNDMRLRGYALSGSLAVDAMYTSPVWVPAIDAIHVAGSSTPVIVPISGVTQYANSFLNGSPCYTGRSGMLFEWRANQTVYASSPRIQPAVPVI